MTVHFVAIAAYLAGLAGYAVWRARQPAGADDVMLGGRALAGPVLAMTLLAAWFGAGTLFGGAGLAYRVGLAALWQAAGAWCGILVMIALSARVRRLGHVAVCDLLGARYGRPARILAALVTVVAYTTLAAYQFRGAGRLLALVGGVDAHAGAVIAAAFCTTFVAAAGMATIARLDVVNGGVMLAGVAVALAYLVGHAGGTSAALSTMRADQLSVFGVLSPREALGLFLPTLVLLLGDAPVFQKLSAGRDRRAAIAGAAGWFALAVILEAMFVALAVWAAPVLPGLTADESDIVIARLAVDVLPTALGLLLALAAMALIVSAANSTLLIAATNLVRGMQPDLPDSHVVRRLRAAVVGLGLAALLGAWLTPALLGITLTAYSMYGAAIAPALIAAIAWPRATREAGLWSIAVGIALTAAWESIGALRGGAATPDYLLGAQPLGPALAASVAVLVGLTLTDSRRQRPPSSSAVSDQSHLL